MKLLIAISIALLTFFTTCFTVFVERPVHSQEQMKEHRTGYPLTFVRQDLSHRYQPATFPQYFCFTSPKDSSFSVEFVPFLMSWAIFFIVLTGVLWGAARLFFKNRK